MIIQCPSCHSKFALPKGAIEEDGRDVRCSVCKHKWHQYPVYEEEKKPTPPITKEKKVKPLWIRWTMFGVTVTALLVILLAGRVDIIRAWHPMVKFYSLIGLPRLPIDLALKRQNIEVVMELQNGKPTPFLRGQIINTTEEPRGIPYIRLTFYNEEECQTKECELSSFAMSVAPENKKLEIEGKKTYDFKQPLIEPMPKGTQAITAKFDLTSVY